MPETLDFMKKLEEIKSENLNGKELLKNFFERERKTFFAENAKSIINESQNQDSNIYKFATLLEIDRNINTFKKAGEELAESLDKRSLFYDLIYKKSLKNSNWLNSKSKIKTFLTTTALNISEKLKSDTPSSVLEVFIPLVMWNFILMKEEVTKQKTKKETKETDLPNPTKKYSKQEQELEQWLYNKDSGGNYMPSPTDINQSGFGAENCYMLGILISLAKRDPLFIKNKLIQIKDDIIVVSLNDYESSMDDPKSEQKKELYQKQEICKPLKKCEYKLSKKEIETSDIYNWNKHKANWVFAIELAFGKLLLQYHSKDFETTFGTIIKIKTIQGALSHGSSPAIATTILTGKTSKRNIFFPHYHKKRKVQKKFPENAEYDEYCIKIRDRILKHLAKFGSASSLMVASFEGVQSPKVSRKSLYNTFKNNPKLLLQFKRYIREAYAVDCIELLDSETTFADSGLYWRMSHNIATYLEKHIEESEFKIIKDLMDKTKSKSVFDLLEKNPELIKQTYHKWYPNIVSNSMPFKDDSDLSDLYEELIEIMTEKDFYIKSKYFDRMLKNSIVPTLSECKYWDTPEGAILRKRIGVISEHAYAILNCFEDEKTKYWYVTLQNTAGKESRIDYTKSVRVQRLKKLTVPPNLDSGTNNLFNMELADFCKYLNGLSYDTEPK